jgi:hypothetical protein
MGADYSSAWAANIQTTGIGILESLTATSTPPPALVEVRKQLPVTKKRHIINVKQQRRIQAFVQRMGYMWADKRNCMYWGNP